MEQRKPICEYALTTPDASIEWGTEVLYVYLPTGEGYIRHQVIHTVMAAIGADTWRLGCVCHVDDTLSSPRPITSAGAEWEMAVKLQDRCDFIGGRAHGDEKFSSLTVTVDGVEKEMASLSEKTPFDELCVTVASTGYDPNEPDRAVLLHHKRLIFSAEMLRVEQSVRFLTDEVPSCVYFGMMPPCKEYTDHFYTNINPEPREIPAVSGVFVQGKDADLKSVTLIGKEGYLYRMTAEKYNEAENSFIISDNRGNPYNKLYFPFSADAPVHAGDEWSTVTLYEIQYK